tara:strand:- start:56 stop:661 length:606 start_codon:yes stop_codon:yes gene_type:complete
MSNNNILKLFPQPVFKYQIDNFKKINEELTKYIYELNKKDNIGVNKSNINGWHSRSFDFNEKENVPNKFYSHINSYIEDVFSKLGWEYDKTKIKCTSMWAIINKKGNFNIEHTHPNNYLSAAYYVKAPDNCGNFKATNPNILSRHIRAKTKQANELNSNSASIKINEGDLLIFPAYLPHSVEENKSDEDRVIVSFNIDILK